MTEVDLPFGDVWVDLPEDLVQRLFDLAKAVAYGSENGEGELHPAQAEAVNLVTAIEKVLYPVLTLDMSNEKRRPE